MMLRMNVKNKLIFHYILTLKRSKLEEIQQSKRVDDDGGGGVGGGRRWQSGHRSRDEHGRDGEAGIGVGDSAIGSRMREHPHGDDEKGRRVASMGAGGEK
jgi:hypothetical protein